MNDLKTKKTKSIVDDKLGTMDLSRPVFRSLSDRGGLLGSVPPDGKFGGNGIGVDIIPSPFGLDGQLKNKHSLGDFGGLGKDVDFAGLSLEPSLTLPFDPMDGLALSAQSAPKGTLHINEQLIAPSLDSAQSLPLDDVPQFVEKYSAFVCKEGRTPREIIHAIADVFNQLQRNENDMVVDFDMNAKKHRIIGSAYVNDISCKFKVKLFRATKSSDQVLVEVQRRSGCVVSFSVFYRTLLTLLGETYVPDEILLKIHALNGNEDLMPPTLSPFSSFSSIESEHSSPASSSSSSSSRRPKSRSSIRLDSKTAHCLYSLIISKDLPKVRDALCTLASLTKKKENHLVFFDDIVNLEDNSKSRWLPQLAELILDRNVEVARFAAVILANLASDPDTCSRIRTFLGESSSTDPAPAKVFTTHIFHALSTFLQAPDLSQAVHHRVSSVGSESANWTCESDSDSEGAGVAETKLQSQWWITSTNETLRQVLRCLHNIFDSAVCDINSLRISTMENGVYPVIVRERTRLLQLSKMKAGIRQSNNNASLAGQNNRESFSDSIARLCTNLPHEDL